MDLPRIYFSAWCLGLLALAMPTLSAADDGMVWCEGEAATSSTMAPHNWYSGMVHKDQLSGGEWISNFSTNADGLATYELTIPQDGDYTFWVRANPIAAALAYRIGAGEWIEIETGKNTDVVNLASDDKPDLRFLAWMNVGKLPMKAGKIKLSFKMHSSNSHHGAIDCFVLTQKPFQPNGKMKPGQKLGTADKGWFAFEPDADVFAKDAQLDLRSLNEKVAGKSGFVQAKGDDFLLGNGKPVRFWAANVGLGVLEHDDASMEYLAARLAKQGFNLVRLHGGLFDRAGNDPTKIDQHRLERYFKMIDVLKKQGIYVHLSTYFPLWMHIKDSDGIDGAAKGKHPFGLLICEPRFQEIYRSWCKQLITAKSPLTGKTLAEESAVAIWEIQNEDSLFFWTFTEANVGVGPWSRFETRFGEWLTTKYGDLQKASAAWSGEKNAHDNFSSKRVGLYDPYHLTGGGMAQSSPGKRARATDQAAFFATVQRDFYTDTSTYLRSLGLTCTISASNWTTADNRTLGGLERYTYTSVDVVDKHGYFGGKHEGDAAGYSVRAGHSFEDKAAVLDPESVPIGYLQMAGHPNIQSEIAWNKPNRFMADGNLLIATYAGLQGIDSFILFATDKGGWETSGNGNWPMMMPSVLGQSPAAALQFRRGDLKAADTIIRQVTPLKDLLALKGAGIVEGSNVDFRIAEAPKAGDASQISAFDPLSYYVGRVERTTDEKAKPVATDLRKYINRTDKSVTSITGEVVWKYGSGLLTVNTAKSQAASGYLAKAGVITLGDVTIACANEYGTIHVICLDDKPITSSKRILVQAFTEEKMYGYLAENGVLKDIGRPPITVRRIDAKVTFKNAPGAKATVLDENGVAKEPAVLIGGVLTVPATAMYTVISR